MLRLFTIILCLTATTVLAAPKEIKAVYHATRNGQPFATVTETFSQSAGRYRIESVTEGIGVYALFGKRRLVSEGEVTRQGLRPLHFEQQQGNDAKRKIVADFDWAASTLSMQVKGKSKSAELEPGAQDILSYAYQFMFEPPKTKEIMMPVTTGKRLKTYHYRVDGRDVVIDSGAGQFRTVHLVEAMDDKDKKELWLATGKHYLPVRIAVEDEDDGRIEQTLTSLHVK